MLEIGGIVAFDPSRQNMLFPCGSREFEPLQLLDHAQHAVSAAQLHSRSDVLPSEQKLHEVRRRYGLDLSAHAAPGQTMNPRQQHSSTPLDAAVCAAFGRKFAAHRDTG